MIVLQKRGFKKEKDDSGIKCKCSVFKMISQAGSDDGF